ncbi:hypothetical protein V8C35DRAFT_305479 [Trichoderma chlorosporum]
MLPAWEVQSQQSESDDDAGGDYRKEERDINGEDDDDDDDDYDNRNEENSEDEDDEQHKIRKAMSAVMDIFSDKTTKVEVDSFMVEHNDVIKEPDSTSGATFLHRLIEAVHRREGEKPLNSQHVKPLIRRIVRQFPYLLRISNTDGQTPLYQAIKLKRYTWNLIDPMLKGVGGDSKCVKDALEKPCSDGGGLKTCLTVAFEKDLKFDVLEKLLSYAGDRALKVIDGSGIAPFHLAVQYSQCNDERVKIIKLLLRKDDAVLRGRRKRNPHQPVETFLDLRYKRQNVEYSVYREHERSLKAYLAQNSKEAQASLQEAPLNQTQGKAQHSNPDKVPPKLSNHRGPKDPKSRDAASLHDGAPSLEEVNERQKQEPEKLNHKNWRQPREEEEKNKNERTLQEKNKEQEKNSRIDEKPTRYEANGREKSSTRQPIAHDATQSYLNSPSAAPTLWRDQVANTRSKRTPTVDFQANADEQGSKTAQNSASKKKNSEMLAKNSTKILKMLKLHYMRTRNIKMATSFLYGRNNINDFQIYFDYSGLPDKIDSHTFEDRFGKDDTSGIRFDDVLMYVRFPLVTVTLKGRNARPPRAKGREDMEFFFGWLHRKGVRRILRVEVDDGGPIPHSDESIRNSLDKIIIEHLDWSKRDLDPRLICQISSNAKLSDVDFEDESLTASRNELREIKLQWSGNNAVLRAWSEINGLPQLPKLKVINLSIPTQADLGYDSVSWVESNIDEFRRTLNQNAREIDAMRRSAAEPEAQNELASISGLTQDEKDHIEVKLTMGKKGTEEFITSGTTAPIVPEKPPSFTEHEWISYMENFAKCMNLLWRETLENFEQRVKSDQNDPRPLNKDIREITSLKEDVIVALIDDGVDSCDPAFAGRVIEGKTFDYQEGGVGQHYISARGHGTEMARMILKACPMASIYSIRLKTHLSPDKGQATIDVFSAASAIEAALDKKATIISMSWTIPIPAEGSKEKQRLDSVLERACSEKVLMFCSSSDQISTTQHYPSAYKRSQFLLIGAAHDDGSPYGHSGRGNDFIFPGVNVRTNDDTETLPKYLARKTSMTPESTGSSIATALAAGFAAMIIYCFKASVLGIAITRVSSNSYIDEADIVSPTDLDRLSDSSVLKRAFGRVGEMETGSFIPIWEKFREAIEILQSEKEYKKKSSYISKFCSNLIDR